MRLEENIVMNCYMMLYDVVAVDKLKATGCSYEVDSVAAVDVDRAVCC